MEKKNNSDSASSPNETPVHLSSRAETKAFIIRTLKEKYEKEYADFFNLPPDKQETAIWDNYYPLDSLDQVEFIMALERDLDISFIPKKDEEWRDFTRHPFGRLVDIVFAKVTAKTNC